MPEQPPPNPFRREPPPLKASAPGYTVKDWNGHDLYDCNDCPWDTTAGEALMREHQAEIHGRQQTTTAARLAQSIGRNQDRETLQ